MGEASPARRVALSVVGSERRRHAYARELLRASSGMAALGPNARALASRLVLGSTAARGELDRRLDSYLNHPSRVEPRVRDALRLAAFEICYLDTPPAVAVSQGVELVRDASPRAAGLANAVLRRLAATDRVQIDGARARVATQTVAVTTDDLVFVSGLPSWLVEGIEAGCGMEAAREACACQLEPAGVWVAADVASGAAASTFDLLVEAGLSPRETCLPNAFLLEAPAHLATSGLVASNVAIPADLAAQLVAAIAAPAPGASFLEVGQGRATKTLLMQGDAITAGGPARITSTDVSPKKVELARERTKDLPGPVIEVPFDAMRLADDDLPSALAHAFDVVFVDAPCSGTGTMRRHPEIPWDLAAASVDPTEPGSLPVLQLRMLEAASARVRAGGVLVYATCSLLREENEGVVETFLASDAGRGFSIESALEAPCLPALGEEAVREVESHLTSEGLLRSHPTLAGCDGHFCCRMRRA